LGEEMKIGDNVRLKGYPAGIVWRITGQDTNYRLLLEWCNSQTLFISSKWIDVEDLKDNYVKVDKDGNQLDMYDWMTYLPGVPSDSPSPLRGSGSFQFIVDCTHEWKEYTGLREVYKYCTKCDAKKGIDE
jgi:hypothetical protein